MTPRRSLLAAPVDSPADSRREEDDAERGALVGRRIAEPGMFDDGLAAAVDALARAAFLGGLAAARLKPPLQDREAFYAGLIEGIHEADLAFAARS
ncbi:MAG TPA: hypothetical protein VLQ79_00555 [Myxococcaceae bacterium]|nr:hypothetical protein [Myxococcaceae bacterium]